MATELLSYNEFVGLMVIAIALGLKRVDLKKKVRTFSILLPYITQPYRYIHSPSMPRK